MTEVAAIVLAAGLGSRYRAADATAPTKLVADFDGMPLVRHAVLAALASRADPVIVVAGHAANAVRAALDGLPVQFVDNARHAEGMATTVQAGVAAVPHTCAGAVVLLGDMPRVTAALIDRLIAAFAQNPSVSAVVPICDGVRGNPVVLSRVLFGAVAGLTGDQGARKLLAADPRVLEVEIADAAIGLDIDTPAQLADLASRRAP
jgi:molybdenum cofactor cytidylyltransferase